MAKIKDCWCLNCGHPVMHEGVALLPEDDYDRTGAERDRCADVACESYSVASYVGGILVAAERCRDCDNGTTRGADGCAHGSDDLDGYGFGRAVEDAGVS